MSESTPQYPPLPPDDLQRTLTLSRPDTDQTLPHIGLVGDTYTITVSGDETKGRFCVIDMHIPPDGGPAPHRHDFEETFILLEGEMEATFRGKKSLVRAGDTINIPANAPHQFHNSSSKPVRVLCICSPAGQENSSKKWVSPLRLAPPLLPSSTRSSSSSSWRRRRRLLPNTILNY